MATTSTSTAIAAIEPVFTEPERLALAGFLAGYTGLTREAYALDLRQYASWCAQHQLRLFQARHADIECFARDLEARGRARATITRRLCTIAGFYKYAVEEELLDTPQPLMSAVPAWTTSRMSPAWTATNSARCWSPPGSASPPSTPSSRCWPSTGCVSPKPPAPTSSAWASSAGTVHWWSPARAARSLPSRSRRGPPGRSTWPPVSVATGRCSWPLMGADWTGTVPPGSSAGPPAAPGSPSRSGRTRCGTRSLPRRK